MYLPCRENRFFFVFYFSSVVSCVIIFSRFLFRMTSRFQVHLCSQRCLRGMFALFRTTKLFSLAAVCPSVDKKDSTKSGWKRLSCFFLLFLFFAQPYRKAKTLCRNLSIGSAQSANITFEGLSTKLIPWSGTIIIKHDGLDLIDSRYVRLWVFSHYRLGNSDSQPLRSRDGLRCYFAIFISQ